MDLNWCMRLATLFLVCLLECRSQNTRCINIDKVVRLTSTAVEVNWTVIPEAGEQYVVAYGFEGQLTQMSVLADAASGGPYRLFIDSLHPNMDYCFRVQVVGLDPNCSEVQCINTSVTLPTEVPSEFTAVPTGPTQVEFSWFANSPVLLSCHTTKNLIVFSQHFSGSIQSKVIGGQFTAYTEYICYISVVVSVGVVGPSSTVRFRTLQDAPGSPPTNVVITAVSPYRVRVTWSPPTTPNGIITQYRLSATFKGLPLSIIAVSGSDLTHTIDGLTPFGIIAVTVSARTAVGQGPSSPTVIHSTLEAPPDSPPTNVTITTVSSDQVRVTWSPPTTPNGIITQYTLYATFNGLPRPNIVLNLTHADIDGLTPFGVISVRISASTSAGEGPSSATMTLRTPDASPGTPPTNVALAVVSPYQVRVTWSPPTAPNGIITQYRLSAIFKGLPLPNIFVPGDDLTHDIDGLTPFGIVNVTISASTIKGEGPSSLPETIKTPPAPPSEVTNFLVSVLSDTSLVIFWGPPEQPNGILTHYAYTVSANPVTPGPEQTIAANDSQTHYIARVNSLNPFVQYVVVAYAVNSAGAGALQSSKVYTRESVPHSPEIIKATRRSSNSMQVDWTAENTGGFITRYTVEYEPLYTSTVDCQRQSVDVPLSEAVSRDSNTITINGLQSGYFYAVSVTAYNSIGASPRSAPATVASLGFVSGDTNYSNATRSSIVQLRLSGVENCSTWIEENTSVDLVSAIAVRLSIICPTCGYTSVEWLMDSILQCTGREDQVLFRAVLSTAVCSGPTLSCSEHLEFWASLQHPFLRFRGQILLVDSTCPLYTDSLTSADCTNPTCILSTGLQGGAIAGSFLGGVLAGSAFSLILIIAYFLRKSKRGRNAKSSDNDSPTLRYIKPNTFQEEPDPGYEPLPLHTSWVGSKCPEDSRAKNQTTSHYEDDDNQYEYPCIVASSLPSPIKGKAKKKSRSKDTGSEAESERAPKAKKKSESKNTGSEAESEKAPKAKKKSESKNTGSEAESEKAPKRVKELRSASSAVQKKQRVLEASNTSEQRTSGGKMPLLPPGQGAVSEPQPQPVSKSRQVQDGDKARGSPPIVQPKPKNKTTGNISLQQNAAYVTVRPAAGSLSSGRANV